MEDNNNYRTRLQAKRKLATPPLTLEDLAAKTGVNISTLVTLDNGRTAKRKLADFFGVAPEELFPR
jgi:hypothetical protein